MRIVVFSGAGISAESGINTFRDSNGLWENYNVEDVATPAAWEKDPDLVTCFYNERRKKIIGVIPNKAHLQIAQLEKNAVVSIVTQNIDDLHERAGSTEVLHLHGNIMYAKSSGPNQEKEYYKLQKAELGSTDLCPEGFRLRPHVVWFGESVPAYDVAAEILARATVLIVIGTSLQVYPAAGLIHYANQASHKFIVDPKANEFDLPEGFIPIQENASLGIRIIIEKYLRELFE